MPSVGPWGCTRPRSAVKPSGRSRVVRPPHPDRSHRMSPAGPGYFVGWGTLALINAGLAQGKNRSGLNWFLVSLLLGPIATFVLVAVMDKLPEASYPKQVEEVSS